MNRPRRKKYHVEAFRVWRLGTALKWRVSCQEIADELGLSRNFVGSICSARGWRTQPDPRDHGHGLLDVDVRLNKTH